MKHTGTVPAARYLSLAFSRRLSSIARINSMRSEMGGVADKTKHHICVCHTYTHTHTRQFYRRSPTMSTTAVRAGQLPDAGVGAAAGDLVYVYNVLDLAPQTQAPGFHTAVRPLISTRSTVCSTPGGAGTNEAPLLLKPFLPQMTNSELFAIMVNGFSSIAGSVMVVYINLGAPANHLLIACVLSAPAALAIAKIMYPETKTPLSEFDINGAMKMSPYTNLIEAATLGALDAIPLCAGIAANLMAALSMFSLLNNILVWIGQNLGMQRDLTLEMIFSYFFWPLAYTMGVPASDCSKVAELLGVKTILSEFVAYRRFGECFTALL
ncbi:unnamed protein product [Schistocephalus solidus]|uniref:Nucleos_tra2_C domain-containing protein n=1 Tax=Schistocephalus solidus TaxID=70667 RepID=A0A183SX02_SCHSO|nr:unnamed protein product [Schistocephalus solidus]